jgi:hypothetical protein
MARWVVPVLVGPSTAVTPAPGARLFGNSGTEEDKDIMTGPHDAHDVERRSKLLEVSHNATLFAL